MENVFIRHVSTQHWIRDPQLPLAHSHWPVATGALLFGPPEAQVGKSRPFVSKVRRLSTPKLGGHLAKRRGTGTVPGYVGASGGVSSGSFSENVCLPWARGRCPAGGPPLRCPFSCPPVLPSLLLAWPKQRRHCCVCHSLQHTRRGALRSLSVVHLLQDAEHVLHLQATVGTVDEALIGRRHGRYHLRLLRIR